MTLQLMVSFLSLGSIALSYWPGKDWRRYGCLAGLAAQPCWVALIVSQELWGILPIAPAFTGLYLMAIWDQWWRTR